MSSWSYPVEMFVKGCLVSSFVVASYLFGVVGSLFLIGVGLLLFGLSVVGRVKSDGRYQYPAVFIEVIMAVTSIGVVWYVYSVDYISFGYGLFLGSFILFAVSLLGWFMSENKFLYHFVYLRAYDWGSSGRRVLEFRPSRFELYLLDRIYEREVDFNRLFESMEVCVVNTDEDEFWLTFVNDLDVLLRDSFEGRERSCEMCRVRGEELVETGGNVDRFRSRKISMSTNDMICEECRDDLLWILVDRGLIDETDVFVSRI